MTFATGFSLGFEAVQQGHRAMWHAGALCSGESPQLGHSVALRLVGQCCLSWPASLWNTNGSFDVLLMMIIVEQL